MEPDWIRLSNAQLLKYSSLSLAELRSRGVVRTGNAPAGDLAERLVADAMGGRLAANAQKSWDVCVESDGKLQLVQVKARVVTDLFDRGQRQLSAFRSWGSDSVMIVLFDGTYGVRRASLLLTADVQQEAQTNAYVAADRLFATDHLLDRGEDWTDRLRAVELWDATGDADSLPWSA